MKLLKSELTNVKLHLKVSSVIDYQVQILDKLKRKIGNNKASTILLPFLFVDLSNLGCPTIHVHSLFEWI